MGPVPYSFAWRQRAWALTGALLLILPAAGARAQHSHSLRSAADELPTLDQVMRVVLLRDYNTRVVVTGTALLGMAAGLIGSFMLLRRRALLGDALSHATLPGICIAFMLMVFAGGSGKWLPGLLAGAVISGSVGVLAVLFIRHFTRLKEDAALGIVLSVFFGIGVSLLGVIQRLPVGSAAGLETFIYGKTAAMLRSDAVLIAWTALAVAITCALLFKEFRLLCFDQEYAGASGWPVLRLDLLMMALVTGVTVIGLQAVGLILVIALLIVPPAAARFWTNRLGVMMILAALIGALSGLVGAGVSALVAHLPAGAIIVVVASAFFIFSMIFGSARGVLVRSLERWQIARKVGRDNLLRALYEWGEAQSAAYPMPLQRLALQRSWSAWRLRQIISRAVRNGLVTRDDSAVRLTPRGLAEAQRVVRNHRLWEIYMITHAEVAASHVDRGADQIEHVLGDEMVEELERLLVQENQRQGVPQTPHLIHDGS